MLVLHHLVYNYVVKFEKKYITNIYKKFSGTPGRPSLTVN